MTATTIKLGPSTKKDLDLFKEYKNESYDEVVTKLLFIAKNIKENPELSQETIVAIENARERIKQGKYITEEEALARLGM